MASPQERRPTWQAWLVPAVLAVVVAVLLALWIRGSHSSAASQEGWEFVVSDLVDGNTRLRQEVDALQAQVAGYDGMEQGGAVLQLLVDEVNALRVANGLIEVSGPGVEVTVAGPVSVLDLQDLINELRNAGAEALALDGRRLAAWSAIGSDGQDVTVDGQPVTSPYQLQAIGDSLALDAALTRPGGLLPLLLQARTASSIQVRRIDKLTLPVYSQPFDLVYAQPAP